MPFEGAFSPVHWIIIAVVAFIVLGPQRLPDAARAAGRAWRAFHEARSSLADQVGDVFDPGRSDANPREPDSSGGMPEIARQMGGALREVQQVHQSLRGELHDVVSGFDAASSPQAVPGGDRVPSLPPKEAATGTDADNEPDAETPPPVDPT